MAETEERSLDNFFAKRDKKKKKERSSRAANAASGAGGSSLAPGARPGDGGSSGSGARPGDGGSSGSGARSGDGGSSGSGARSGDGGTSRSGDGGSSGSAGKAVTKDEDEWKEFEQKEVDYSGLRVQAMQISEKEDDDNEKREDPGDNWEEGGGGSGVEKSSGPWNKTAPVQAPPAPVIVTETPEPAMPSGVYRPPGARLTTTRKTPQGPPEIYSDTQFPSLQSTAKHVESRKDKEMEKSFEVVRHKNRGREEVSKNQALKLQLDNQYAVLENQKYSHTQYS
ncbi:protein CDV3 homolog isoform X1 [Peromyscus eremicus]|uniref:protein CDV3 homolog isoform X1 n=3 Tax=Peromyscus eremicus TaxID=42410 RepID=UPI0027DD11EE|nr:protein CDV3 homolog isoform X1 [Peromyscus eremicus]